MDVEPDGDDPGATGETVGWDWKQVPRIASRKARSRGTALAPVIVPLAAAALFWSIGRRTVSGVVLGIAAVVFCLLRLRRIGPALQRYAVLLAHATGRALTVVSLVAIYALMFAPVALLMRLIGHDSMESLPDRGRRSYWRPVARSEHWPLYNRQFGYERSATAWAGGRWRWVRRAVSVTAVGVLANMALGQFFLSEGILQTPRDLPFLPSAAAWGRADWHAGYIAEFWSSWRGPRALRVEPFYGFRRNDFSGQYINVADGVRRSYEPLAGKGRPITIFFFGGSTMWGSGSRDLYTIPSDVARMAERDGFRVRVVNYGETAWSIWQEEALFSQLLAGGATPDVAVFYDGLNDLWAQFETPTRRPTVLGFDQMTAGTGPDSLLTFATRCNAIHIMADAAMARLRNSPPPGDVTASDLEQRTQNAVTLYGQALGLILRLSSDYHVRPFAFWQPTIYTKKLHPSERPLYELYRHRQRNGEAYRRAAELRNPQAIDLGGVLDGLSVPVMLDHVHLNEAGNLAVAGSIYDTIAPALREIRATGRAPGARN